MKKLSFSLFALLAIVFAVASAFNSAPKNFDDLKYTVYGVDFEGVLSTNLPSERTTVTSPTAASWVDTYDEFFLANKVDEDDTNPIDLDAIRTTYCDETFDTYICLIQIERNGEDVPVLVAKNSLLSQSVQADYIFGDFSQP